MTTTTKNRYDVREFKGNWAVFRAGTDLLVTRSGSQLAAQAYADRLEQMPVGPVATRVAPAGDPIFNNSDGGPA
jgi:hypothetical protein